MPFDLRALSIPGRQQGTASTERRRAASTRDDRFLLALPSPGVCGRYGQGAASNGG
ncbi:hypothetical protein L810_5429 [Burkholderia sp. AU4i]|nr:hypothetical protein L810_5429 [Burkholderia sp. AU4i]